MYKVIKHVLKFDIFFLASGILYVIQLHISVRNVLLAAERSGNLHVFQWHIATRNIHFITTKLEKEFDLGQHNDTAKSHEDIITVRLKKKSFKFDIFFLGCQTFWNFTCFSTAYFKKKYSTDHNQTWGYS